MTVLQTSPDYWLVKKINYGGDGRLYHSSFYTQYQDAKFVVIKNLETRAVLKGYLFYWATNVIKMPGWRQNRF